MTKRSRPVSIQVFEWSVYLGLVVGAFATLLYYQETAEQITAREVALILGLTIGINLVFVWLIAYRASNVVKWIFVALVALSTVFFAIDLVVSPQPSSLIVTLTSSVYILSTVEILLLFRRDSRDWFAGRQRVDPDIFG